MQYYVFYFFTGLPKAAVITHLQSLKAAAGFWAFGATKDDVIYIPLPLYHSAASLIGIGGTIELGRPQKISKILLYSLYKRLMVLRSFRLCQSCMNQELRLKQTPGNCYQLLVQPDTEEGGHSST